MSVSIFRYGRRLGTSIKVPSAGNEKPGWQPQVNDRFPDISAVTTRGTLSLHEWARGGWVYLMTHPAAYTPVCSTELGELAKRIDEFEERNVRVIALTRDTVEEISAWTRQIEAVYKTKIEFPHIADPHGVISRACGMVSREAEWNGPLCARRTYLIDPQGIIRAIFDYPLAVGRSVAEALRTIDALQIASSVGAYTPGEWKLGDPLLTDGLAEEKDKRFANRKTETLTPYLEFVDLSRPATDSDNTRSRATTRQNASEGALPGPGVPGGPGSPPGEPRKDSPLHQFPKRAP